MVGLAGVSFSILASPSAGAAAWIAQSALRLGIG